MLGKLIVPQVIKKLSVILEADISLPYSRLSDSCSHLNVINRDRPLTSCYCKILVDISTPYTPDFPNVTFFTLSRPNVFAPLTLLL
jgi:hypothetical protein